MGQNGAKQRPKAMSQPTPDRTQMVDLARIAGVSVSTVSRALAGSTLVNEKTRKRIVELAGQLRFSVNVGAQNLRRGQTQTIAVVLPKAATDAQPVSDPFFIALLGELADALTSHGYDMLFTRINEDNLDDLERIVRSGRALGVIVIGQWQHHYALSTLANRNTPMAVWGAALPGAPYSVVGSDNRLGGQLATRRFLTGGRKRILFLGDTRLPEVALRFEGYRDALIEAKLMVNPGLTAAVPFEAAAAKRTLADLFHHTQDFDAIFACSDLIAMTAVALLHAGGRAVPEDVWVIGYDDLPLASQMHPTLTSVKQPLAEAATALVDAVLAAQRGGAPKVTVLETRLVERESTVAARAPVTKSKAHSSKAVATSKH